MIEIHDDWFYLGLWYVRGPGADYTVLAFRRDHRASPCEATARFRFFKTEVQRLEGLVTGAAGWFPVPTPSGATHAYVLSMAWTLVTNIAQHPVMQPVTRYAYEINDDGAALRDALANAPWTKEMPS